MGNTAKTKSGKSCQRWDSNSPHIPNIPLNPNDFPEKSVEAAGNKCRNPDKGDSPWCYTKNPQTRWEFCDIPMCDGNSVNEKDIMY